MRLLTGPIKIGKSQSSGGANTATFQRDRKGYATFFSVGDAVVHRVTGQRIFTPDELYRIYQICPDVRAPVDKISLRVANTPYMIQAAVKKDDPRYAQATEYVDTVARFLKNPNMDSDWTTLAQRWAQDSLIYDAYAVERVRGVSGKLQELVIWRGGDVTPLQDEHARVYSYRQDASINGPVFFLPEDMDYGNIFPNTMFPNGQPIIETLVEEFITMRAQAQHLRKLVDADEIPPGILALVGVSDVALKRFDQKMKAQKGQDDLFRIVSTEEAGGKIEWIQLQRSLKDLEWLPNIREVRKTIWRLFHVTPVTMGETDAVPRASAEVQVEIADQGLIGPMLRRLEQLVNDRWIPLLLGNPDAAKLVYFSFDLTPDLSQLDQKVRAERLQILTGSQILTRDEAREELGYDPSDAKPEEPAQPEADPADGSSAEASARRPGVIRSRDPVPGRGRSVFLPTRGALPSDWQPAGRFKGLRTLPLQALGDLVAGYDDTVTPLYDRCARNVLRAATDAVADGAFTQTEATSVVKSVAVETVDLINRWSEQTATHYEDAARIGADTAEGWGGSKVAWRSMAAVYQSGAVGYLSSSGGIVTALRQELTALVLATLHKAPQRRTVSDEAEKDKDQRAEALPAALGAFLEAVRRVFDRHRHRIKNWSGKLVELAHTAASQSLRSPVTFPASDGEPATTEDRWMVEWVEVADGSTCGVCRAEGAKDFRPLSDLSTMPGGATECGARCRCVLVYWLESEVKSGKAKRLGPVRSMRVRLG
jgi:phage portal protein BeeE